MTTPSRTTLDTTGPIPVLEISGPLTDTAENTPFAVLDGVDPADPVVINVSAVTTLSESGYQALFRTAEQRHDHGTQVTVVCDDVMLRHELALTDLDEVADVVDTSWFTLSQPRQDA